MNRIVLTMKWGHAFSPDYVNVLHSAVSKNIDGPYTFVCLTEDAEGLRKGIEVLPLPDIGLTPEEWYTPAVWPKLGLFNKDLFGLSGRALFLDLDTMIMGSITRFFEVPGQTILQDMGSAWRARPREGPSEPGTCIFAYTIGEQSHIPAAFMADKDRNKQAFRNEQDFVAAHALDLHVWPAGWVRSFKRHIAGRNGLDLLANPAQPSEDVPVIAFHGRPRPADLIRSGIWGAFPHIGRGPVAWVKDYWDLHREI